MRLRLIKSLEPWQGWKFELGASVQPHNQTILITYVSRTYSCLYLDSKLNVKGGSMHRRWPCV